MKFENVAEEWLKYKKNSIEISTYYDYKRIIENQLKPSFKNVNIDDITNLNDYIYELSKNYAPRSIRKTISVIKAIISYYEEEYECKIKVKKINLPKVAKSEVEAFTKKEKARIEKYCINENTLVNMGILIALSTGLRVGEICGLKWKNVDLVENKIYIKEIVERVYDCEKKKSMLIVKNPKTENSRRSVLISNKLCKVLKTHKNKYDEESYVLSGSSKIIEPRTYENIFNDILKKNKITHKKFQCLRHTFATNCIELGMDTKSLSEMLGHSDTSVTLSIYVHSSDKLKKKYIEML